MFGRHSENLFAGKSVKEGALTRTHLAKRRDLDAAVLELCSELLDIVHLLFDARALLRSRPKSAESLRSASMVSGNIDWSCMRSRFRGYELVVNCSACPAVGWTARTSSFVNASTSAEGRRVSIRTTPRASSTSRLTGLGATAAGTALAGGTPAGNFLRIDTRIASRSAA